jgi:hypothetical protein
MRRSVASSFELAKPEVFLSKYKSKELFESARTVTEYDDSVLSSFRDILKLEWILPETRAILERQHRAVPENFNSERNFFF